MHFPFALFVALCFLENGENVHSGKCAPTKGHSPLVVPNSQTGDSRYGHSMQAPNSVHVDPFSHAKLLSLSCIAVLETNFVFSEKSLVALNYFLKSKNVPSPCNKAFSRQRFMLCLLLLMSGNIQPNPGPITSCNSPDSLISNTAGKLDFCMAKGLHIMHLNVRSLLPKLDEIRMMVCNRQVSVMCFTETWLDESVSDTEIEIENFVVLRNDRNRNGGGVCVYIKADICFNHRTEMMHDLIEAVWVDIRLTKSKPLLIGAVYRPPSQNNFFQLLEESFFSLGKDSKKVELILIGDVNTDVSNKGHGMYKALEGFCHALDLKQIIQEPTRIANFSQTIIDLIFVSDHSMISQRGVVGCTMSDHSLIYCTWKKPKICFREHKTIKIRSVKNYRQEDFIDCLKAVNWSPVLCTDVNNAWNQFKQRLLKVLDEVAPIKIIRVKQRSEPWMNSDIQEAINSRNKAFDVFRKSQLKSDLINFKELRKKVQRMITECKKAFFREKIYEYKDNPKKLWQSLKLIGYSKKLRTKANNIGLNIKGMISSDKATVADTFNVFFTSIAKQLVDKLPENLKLFDGKPVFDYYSSLGAVAGSFELSAVTQDNVMKLLKDLKCAKATGLDEMPARFLKDAAEHIAPYLTHVFNLSIKSGIVPSDFKLARVIPLFKKGSKFDEGNYRPVSILSIVSKVLEKLIHEQINRYICNSGLLYELQSGFRKSHSTETCLLFLTDYIRKEIDSGKFCGMVLLDLQKAFDTVDHQILLTKLKALGFNNLACEWIQSYLSGRSQRVDINSTMSGAREITCGVPQGSVLGPLLFLLYINDMKSVCKCNLFLYADDSALLVSHKEKNMVEKQLSEELGNISGWLAESRLSLHLGKTESILFGSKIRLSRSSELKIKVGDTIIAAKNSVKYLGCILDSSLSGESMGQNVVSKTNQKIKFLARKASLLDKETRKLLAAVLIQPQFDYACTSWYSGTPKGIKTKLQTAQNKLIRVVLKLGPRAHIGQPEFGELKWLTVEIRVKQLRLRLAHKIILGNGPQYFKNYFQLVRDSHSYSTRGRETDLVPGRFKSVTGQNTFQYLSAVDWNSLPTEIKLSQTHSIFKKKSGMWLLEQMA